MKRILVSSVVCLGLMLVMASTVQAQKAIEWRIHTPHGEGRSEFVMQKEWADTLSKESNGRLKVTMYPFNALGFKDADMLRVCSENVIEGYLFYPGYITRDDPILGMTSPEMILYDREHFIAYFPYAYEIAKARLAKKWKIRLSAGFPSPACLVGVIGKSPFNTLASMKGKKMRGWEIQQTDTLKKLGIPGQMMAQSELYLALKSGVVDGAIYLTTPYLLTSMYEVAPYWSTLYQGSMMYGMATSEAAFKALPNDLQEMMKRVESNLQKKWLAEANTWQDKYDQPSLAELKKKGANILPEFSLEDRERLINTGTEAWRGRAEKLGTEAAEYQKKLESELVRVKLKTK